VPGGIGSVPPAASGGKIKAGTITWALQPSTSPTWILPIVPDASSSVFSIARPAAYSNGNKTVTISLKSSYKWSNGRPVTANDLLFYIDLVKAAIKASPANWAGYLPGHFPDNLVSTSEPNSTTLVMNLKSAVNPTWFTEDVLGQGPLIPVPSFRWAKTSASGSIPPSGWTPATMAKVFTYLNSQGKSLSTYATNPYPFSISTAVSLLKSNGWNVVPGGTDTCARPGAGTGECGAGIPGGTKLLFNDIYNSSSVLIGKQASDFVSKAKQAGITILLQASNFNYMIASYLDPYAPANENKWAMEDFGGETDEPYATTFGLFNTGGTNQVGDYSNLTADSLINASISGDDPTGVKAEAAFLTADQPVQFEPNPDYIWAWNKSLSAQNPQAFQNLTQYYATPEFWYFNK